VAAPESTVSATPTVEVTREDALLAVLRALGVEPNVANFQSRVRLQKLVYLLQRMSLDLGFSFRWYLHGPYSPDLAESLFELAGKMDEYQQRAIKIRLTDGSSATVNKLATVLDKTFTDTDLLEAMATLAFAGELSEMVIERQKPHLLRKPELIDSARSRVRQLGIA
jgi:uncharacterized protein YwgA